ncbi:MAG: hypothetical protein KHX42_03870 [Prevotella sp.]|nr:hypothetical protein [Prevotella sp.]
MIPFAFQKVSFQALKGDILACNMPPFGSQKMPVKIQEDNQVHPNFGMMQD